MLAAWQELIKSHLLIAWRSNLLCSILAVHRGGQRPANFTVDALELF